MTLRGYAGGVGAAREGVRLPMGGFLWGIMRPAAEAGRAEAQRPAGVGRWDGLVAV